MSYIGNLFIVSAPSGAGKTSLLKAITSKHDTVTTSVSTTTRPIRTGEENGKDYHFVSIAEFKNMIRAGEFLEYAEVFGNFYGTSRSRITEQLNTGNDLVLEIDWQGAQQVRKLLPDATSIFILPPSQQALTDRLIGRAQDDESVIKKRMAAAMEEISHYHEFDYLVINDVFEQALEEIELIIKSHRLTQKKQFALHHQLITDLL